MADFLDEKRKEIDARLRELRPLVDEYQRLEKAAAALQGVGNSGAPARTRGRRRGPAARRGRPRGSGTRSKQALEAATHAWGAGNPGADSWGQEDWVVSQVAKLKSRFIDAGLPVIWGEYGAVNQAGYENYRRYYFEYVTKAVHDAGIVPFVWDNGSTGSGAEAVRLFNRANNGVIDTTLLEALMRAVTSDYPLDDVTKP